MFRLQECSIFGLFALSAFAAVTPLLAPSVCNELANFQAQIMKIVELHSTPSNITYACIYPELSAASSASVNGDVAVGVSLSLGAVVDSTLHNISDETTLALGGSESTTAELLESTIQIRVPFRPSRLRSLTTEEIVSTVLAGLHGQLQGAGALTAATTNGLLHDTDSALAKLVSDVSASAAVDPSSADDTPFTTALSTLLEVDGTADLLRNLGLELTLAASGV